MGFRFATMLLAGSCLLMAATGNAQPPAATGAVVDPDLLAFAGKLRSCTPATATQPHPLMRGFSIEHAVTGLQDARCDYSQGMPGNMRMVCAFDEAARAAYADELERTATTGAMSGSSDGAQPAWASACEIEMASGKRVPFGKP